MTQLTKDQILTIAEKAADAAFKVIADGITDVMGGTTTGDITPWELIAVEDAFVGFVEMFVSNNSNYIEEVEL